MPDLQTEVGTVFNSAHLHRFTYTYITDKQLSQDTLS